METRSKMTFTYQFDAHTPKISVEVSPESTLTDVLDAFNAFLLASGYDFEGQVDIVPTYDTQEVN